jgi:beta-lactamase superfamily II metal-dependent hydrolase
MASRTIIMILYVGQGMCTLVENYDDGNTSPAPDHMVLVDCGGNQKYGDAAASYIVDKLLAQQAAGKEVKFDALIVSHQDKDHLSLLPNLLDAIKEEGIDFAVGTIFLGGARWSAKNKKTVSAFVEEAGGDRDDAEVAEPAQSGYDNPAAPVDLVAFNDVKVRILIAGYVPEDDKRDDIIKNASSAVVVIDNGFGAVVLPGDATYHTMAQINDRMATPQWQAARPLSKVQALEIPHHGALRTAVEDYTARGSTDDFDFSIVTTFGANMAAAGIVSSAGPRNSHNHPLKEVIEVFEGHLATVTGHTYVAYVFNKTKSKKVDGWSQFSTNDAIYTTVVTLDAFGNFTTQNQQVTLPTTAFAGMTVEIAPYLISMPKARDEPAAAAAAVAMEPAE